jgi:hypothetical protein
MAAMPMAPLQIHDQPLLLSFLTSLESEKKTPALQHLPRMSAIELLAEIRDETSECFEGQVNLVVILELSRPVNLL